MAYESSIPSFSMQICHFVIIINCSNSSFLIVIDVHAFGVSRIASSVSLLTLYVNEIIFHEMIAHPSFAPPLPLLSCRYSLKLLSYLPQRRLGSLDVFFMMGGPAPNPFVLFSSVLPYLSFTPRSLSCIFLHSSSKIAT